LYAPTATCFVIQLFCSSYARQSRLDFARKLDDHRVRFKRLMGCGTLTHEFLVNDPYRCYYGSSWQPITWVSVIAVLVVTLLPAYLYVMQSLAPSSPTQIQPSIFPHWNNHQVLKIEALLAGGKFHCYQSSILMCCQEDWRS